ncbi:MAG: hypothetical protein ACI9W4_000536 [Rhodothermales bacterium]|jgi:hypothetical protein
MRSYLLAFLALGVGLGSVPRAAHCQYMFEAPVRPFPDRDVDVSDVRVEATLSASDRSLAVHLRARVQATRRGLLQFVWPTNGAQIDSVRVVAAGGDTTLAVSRGDSLVFSLSSALRLTSPTQLDIWFRAYAGRGIETSDDPSRPNACCLWTNRAWLPLPDDPGDRFQGSLLVSVPESWSVVAAGRLTRPGGSWAFSPVRSIRVNDLGFVAGVLASTVRGGVTYFQSPGLDGDLDALHADVSAASTYFQRKTGYRLPWGSLRVVLGPQSIKERTLPGVQMLKGSRLVTSRTLTEPTDRVDLVSFVARQWTHAVLAPDWWTEAWVNDALAGALALNFMGETGSSMPLARAAMLDRYLAEATRYQRPLVWDRFYSPDDLSDAHAQDKGPLVLHAVAQIVGETVFWSDMRRLLARHAFGSIDSDILMAVLEPDGPGAIARLFDAMVFAAGHPVLSLSSRVEGTSREARAQVRQEQDAPLVPAVFPIDTDLEWLSFNSPEQERVIIRDREQEWSLASDLAPRYVTLDTEGLLVAEFRHEADLASVSARLRYGSYSTRWRAAVDLAAYPNDPAITLSARLAMRAETDAHIRAKLVASVASLGSTASHLELLGESLKDDAPEVRMAGVRSLTHLFPRGRANAALDALARRDTMYTVQAAAVGGMVGSEAEGLARAALITPSEGDVVRAAGISVLSQTGSATDQDFLKLTDPTQSPVRIIQGLSLARSVATTRPMRMRVLALLAHPSPAVRLAGADAGRLLLIKGSLPSVERLARREWHLGVRAALADLSNALR